MTVVNFAEISLRRSRSGKCAGCGCRVRRVCKVWQTINPLNRNKDGVPKGAKEIMEELKLELAQEVTKLLLCVTCKAEKK